jgi:hypothetical protein
MPSDLTRLACRYIQAAKVRTAIRRVVCQFVYLDLNALWTISTELLEFEHVLGGDPMCRLLSTITRSDRKLAKPARRDQFLYGVTAYAQVARGIIDRKHISPLEPISAILSNLVHNIRWPTFIG